MSDMSLGVERKTRGPLRAMLQASDALLRRWCLIVISPPITQKNVTWYQSMLNLMVVNQ